MRACHRFSFALVFAFHLSSLCDKIPGYSMNTYILFFSSPFHSDVLTANDFAGEAFLALGNIPGVADYSTSIENFHGLKQVDLPLMQQNDKSTCVADLVFHVSSATRAACVCVFFGFVFHVFGCCWCFFVAKFER